MTHDQDSRVPTLAPAEQADQQVPSDTDDLVHQATGMVVGQLDVSAADALRWLRRVATAEGRDLLEVARAVVERRLSFDT